MSNVIVFVKYNGRWNENNVHTYKESMGILVPMSTSYVGLLEILFEALKLNPEIYMLWIKYIFEVGCIPVKILNDRGVKFYLELKKNELDKTKFPPCVDIIRESMSMPNEGQTYFDLVVIYIVT